MLCHMCNQRTSRYGLQKFSQCLSGNTFSPIFLSKPVTDFAFTFLFPTENASCHLTIENDCQEYEGLIRHDLRRMCHERFPIACRESCHGRRFGVELLLEENREVSFGHIAQEDFICHNS